MRPLTSLTVVAAMSMPTNVVQAIDPALWLEAAEPTLRQMDRESSDVAPQRRQVLDPAASYIAERLAARQKVQLTFICTHNSRRSHLGQVWAQIAAEYYGLRGVSTYSGGTEATACNIRTVRALRRAGLEVVASTSGDNPKYLLQYAENRSPMVLYSKIYDEGGNPRQEYAAMMCCADADEKCPVVNGAAVRIPLHYIDPKAADNTPEEATTYNQRSLQIAAEMFYVFSKASELLSE